MRPERVDSVAIGNTTGVERLTPPRVVGYSARVPRWPWSRPPLPEPALPDRTNPRIASVQPLDRDFARYESRTRQPWQHRARFFAENLGLIRFANGLTAQTAARCELRAEVLVDSQRGEWEPADNDPEVQEVVRSYRGPDSDSSRDLIARHVWHYQTTGDLFQVVDVDDKGLVWSIRSTQAIEVKTDRVLVKDLPNGSVRDGTARELPRENVRRMWVPDDEWVKLAKSPMKGVLADCERYWALARRIRREAESMLLNGIFFTPGYAHEATRPQRPGGADPMTKLDRDYYRVAEAAFNDDDSVAAVAPLPMHYDHSDGRSEPQAPQFIYPGKALDPNGIAYRQEAVEAIARGLDLPMQLVVSGPGSGASHWSDWLVDERFFTAHFAPTMDRVCYADLTTSFLRPVLTKVARDGRWNGNPMRYRVGYNPAPVIVHPDRAQASVQLYGLGLLQGAVVLEANGFHVGDMPEPGELAKILDMLQTVRRSAGGSDFGASPVGPATTRELPPAPALSALSPYPAELANWIDVA